MGLRMRKSITICKGVKVNLSKTGVGLSYGGNGLRHSIHSTGRKTNTVGIPGTGIYYVNSSSSRKSTSSSSRQSPISVENNQLSVQEYEAWVNSIKSIHKECDEYINWSEVNSKMPPFQLEEIGPNQAKALVALESYNPNFFEKLIKSTVNKKRDELKKAVEIAIEKDKQDYQTWLNLKNLSEKILSGDIDSYLDVIAEMGPLDDLLEYGSDFEFGIDNPNSLEVEFRVKSKTTVPTFSLSLTKTGRVSQKELTKTSYYNLIQDYVCSCSIRIARDMFSILPIDTVIVHGVDTILNTGTGHEEDITILSIKFKRDILEEINFESIDPSDCIGNFEHNMKFLKTSGFREVSRL